MCFLIITSLLLTFSILTAKLLQSLLSMKHFVTDLLQKFGKGPKIQY